MRQGTYTLGIDISFYFNTESSRRVIEFGTIVDFFPGYGKHLNMNPENPCDFAVVEYTRGV
jgi:hypothetical protein